MTVVVTEVEHRPGIDDIGEEQLAGQVSVLLVDREEIKIGVPLVIDMLHDRPQEGPDVELPDSLHLGDVGRIKASSGDRQSFIHVLDVQLEMASQVPSALKGLMTALGTGTGMIPSLLPPARPLVH